MKNAQGAEPAPVYRERPTGAFRVRSESRRGGPESVLLVMLSAARSTPALRGAGPRPLVTARSFEGFS